MTVSKVCIQVMVVYVSLIQNTYPDLVKEVSFLESESKLKYLYVGRGTCLLSLFYGQDKCQVGVPTVGQTTIGEKT